MFDDVLEISNCEAGAVARLAAAIIFLERAGASASLGRQCPILRNSGRLGARPSTNAGFELSRGPTFPRRFTGGSDCRDPNPPKPCRNFSEKIAAGRAG